MDLREELKAALQAHALWYKHFQDFLAGHASFDLDKIDSDVDCAFGQWLVHEGARHIPAELYAEIRGAHADFHALAGAIVDQIKLRNFAAAHAMIAPNGALHLASNQLTHLLLQVPLQDQPPLNHIPRNGCG